MQKKEINHSKISQRIEIMREKLMCFSIYMTMKSKKTKSKIVQYRLLTKQLDSIENAK